MKALAKARDERYIYVVNKNVFVSLQKGVTEMRFRYLELRVLAGLIDVIIVYVPVVVLTMLILHANFRTADILGQLGFVVYNILLITGNQGQTLGKRIGREYVLINDALPDKAMVAGIREVTKAIYFLPFVGWLLGMTSVIVCAFTGRMLHDYFGNSTVVLEKNLLNTER